MKRLILFLYIIPFVFPAFIFAESRVNINVSSDTNSSSTNTSQNTSTTDVTIEVNGEKKTFHAEGDEDINWTSADGKSSVKINSNSDVKPTISPKSASPTLKPTVAKERVKKEIEETKKDIFELLKKEIERIRSLIFDSLRDFSLF